MTAALRRAIPDPLDAAPDPWEPPYQRSLPEILAERVVEAIRTGVLRPGDRIVESQLSRQLGVSRGPLREALKSLEANHIVESRRGRGTFVKRVSEEDLIRMVTLRAGLEGLAARFVASRVTPEILADLSGRLDEMAALARDGSTSAWRDADWRFHEFVCESADNPFLLAAWRSISNLVRLFLHDHPGYVHDVPHVLANHDVLVAALASGEPDRAEGTFRTVILTSAFQRFGLTLPPALASFAEIDPSLRRVSRSRRRPTQPRAVSDL